MGVQSRMAELIFEVRDAEEGGFYARALGKPIFTQADTWDELRSNILEAVEVFFDTPEEQPKLVRLHYVKDELLAVNAA
jgi:predicted RNase H-like HicB family nuclease